MKDSVGCFGNQRIFGHSGCIYSANAKLVLVQMNMEKTTNEGRRSASGTIHIPKLTALSVPRRKQQ